MTNRPLRLLLDFDARSQRDKEQPPAFLHRRDRKFALTCQEQGLAPTPERWMAHMDRLSGPGASADKSQQLLRLWQRIRMLFMLVGAVFGVLTMAGLLFYDAGQRINITVILGFVLLQILLALYTSLQALIGWQPWHWLLRRFGAHTPGAGSMPGGMQPLLMAEAAHRGGTCFALTGLVTLLIMVVIQDLAFGWSTTLDTAAASYHQLVVAIAAPWSWLWPDAVPTLELVEATRFFRADSGSSGAAPLAWGQWWPFVAMVWTFWVLLPRLLLALIATGLVHHRARTALNNHPGMHALLYRMETPTLDTGNENNDAADQPDTRTNASLQPLPDTHILLCWAGGGDPELPDSLAGPHSLILKAGGRATLAEDRHAIEQAGTALSQRGAGAILVITRSWEPPTGELQDFLESAREHWPDNTLIALVPMAQNAEQAPATHQLQPWLRFTERMADPHLQVSVPQLAWQDPYRLEEDRT
ncbi:DUF2868 domain-containing protein [Marinobacter salinexigens]|uniref:DUF2868 domain-containing protein n=1 Tax=Marinobacter salinexigens TaxID=2919747 RepID=A0A5B0VHP3_9GAMM|nr:DUF2868 domain-containing protein [Marinobacter salinexigens]KAA1174210.1 DUF2868 domain-containing protein [Marinobacter salinexigens]